MPPTTTAGEISVSETSTQKQEREERAKKGRPAHWDSDNCSHGFHNPWSSWTDHGFTDFLKMLPDITFNAPPIPTDIDKKLPVRKPTFGIATDTAADKIKTTWLGHACFLVELPRRSPDIPRGPRILFDPVFSDRCSPMQFVGPKRFTPMPCQIEEIPEVDAVVISHNHYDHLDTHTIQTLYKRPNPPHIFLPLGNGPYLRSINVPESHSHLLDWWDSRRVTVAIPHSGTSTSLSFDITCTPGQHFTGRGVMDRFKSLWAGWAVEEVVESGQVAPGQRDPVKVYFGGDTGYRAVDDGQDEDEVPVCPAFKEIGDKFGGFDFAMIPIGAYLPRWFMSPIHCAPQDSVRLFRDIKAKKALGMHWGTWILTTEGVTEPPLRLKEELKKLDIEEDRFGVCEIGETTFW